MSHVSTPAVVRLPLYRCTRRGPRWAKFPQDYDVAGYALLDEGHATHPHVALHHWLIAPEKRTARTSYAFRIIFINRKTTFVYLHNVIYDLDFGPGKIVAGLTVDHIDGDGLNNLATNLRLATRSQQQANKRIQSNNTSGYKGVAWMKERKEGWKRRKPWVSHISVSYPVKTIHLGCYHTKEEAAFAYNVAASCLQGEFAVPNEIDPVPHEANLAEIREYVMSRLRTKGLVAALS